MVLRPTTIEPNTEKKSVSKITFRNILKIVTLKLLLTNGESPAGNSV